MPDKKNQTPIVVLTVFIVAVVLTLASVQLFNKMQSGQEDSVKKLFNVEQPDLFSETLAANNFSRNSSLILLPAVDNKGNGVIVKLKVETAPGNGRVLVNINQLLFWVDTQFSIRVAETVAENLTGVNTKGIDIIYTIESDASVIEGQSAGAALTIATVAAFLNKTINQSVLMTGTINPDGSVGPVGAIVAKAKAAKDLDAKTFLVPEGQGSQVTYVPETECQKIGDVELCTTQYQRQKTDVTKEAGIEIREVAHISEALKIFDLV